MALIVTAPEIIGFSKDRVIWQFEDDRAGIVPGIAAINTIQITASVPDGAQLVLQWGDNELRFYARTTPTAANEIPAYVYNAATVGAYTEGLAEYFENNYFIHEDFTISAESVTVPVGPDTLTIWYLLFTARRVGPAYNFNDRTFNGLSVKNGTPGTNDSASTNNSVFVELYLLDADDENPTRIWKGAIELDTKGQAAVDVGDILHAHLVPEVPSMVLPVAQKCQDSRRGYYLRYAQAGGENLSDIGKLITSATHVILRGGFGERKGAPVTITEKLKAPAGREDKILMLQSKHRYVRADQPVFLTWVNFGETRDVVASVDVVFDDGRTTTTNTNMVHNVGQHEKVIFGVGFLQLNLGIMQGTIAEYTVRVHDALGYVSEPLRLTLNYAHLEYVRYFAYVNSWGAMDTLMTYGRQSDQWKVYKESCEKMMPIQHTSTESQYVEWNQEYELSGEVASGWMRRSDMAAFLDLFIAPVKFRIVAGVAYPVAINSDTIERGRDGDNLYGIVFAYQYARRYDSLEAEELESEDVSDYIPPNVLTAATVIIDNGTGGDAGGGAALRMDPYPIQGSKNAVESGALFVLLKQYQPMLPLGDSTQYYRADGKLMNLKTAVNAAESDPTVPAYAKTLTSIQKLLTDLEEQTPGLNAKLFGGQEPEYYLNKSQHPVFAKLPPVVVEKGVAFVKYVDLKNYKMSYHELTDLKVDVSINNLKFKGVEIDVSGDFVVKLSGKITEDLTPSEQALIVISDLTKNQTSLSIVVQAMEAPEVPDTRPLCPLGPNHYMESAIQIVNNGSLKFPFHGNGVTRIAWKLLNTQADTAALRSGEVNPTSAVVTITFDALPAGAYVLAIAGASCKSPWVYRTFTLAADTTINWAAGYPKYEGGNFLLKLADTAQLLTEIFNVTTGVKMYSATHDYIADTTEISVPRTAGSDAKYKINVGGLTGEITVGTPVEPVAITWQLRSGWDGGNMRNLADDGEYEASLPTGFNIYFQSNNLGFTYNIRDWKLELETAPGVWTQVYNGGASVGSGTSTTVLNPDRMFPEAGADSGFVNYQGTPINRHGKFRATWEFKLNAVIVKTFQKTFSFSKLEWGPTWGYGTLSNYVMLGAVRYNGQAVVTQSMQFIEPWQSSGLGSRTFEYSTDNITWHRTTCWGENDFPGKVGLVLIDDVLPKNLPDGSVRSVRLRNGMNHNIVSDPITIDQRGIVSGNMTLKLISKCLPEHFDLQVVTDPVTGISVMNDLATVTPPDGYDIWYMFNGELIKQKGRLVNYQYPSYDPFSIVKAMIREGEASTYLWATLTDHAAGAGFSKNTSYAFYTGIFNKK